MLLISLPLVLRSQEKAPGAVWWLPGIQWQTGKNVQVKAQLGYNQYYQMGLFYPQAFVTIHKNIVLNPAGIYTNQKIKGAPRVHEVYLMNAAAANFQNMGTHTQLYAYDEIFYLFNQHTIARNRPALGITSDVLKHVNVDITYIRQWDRYAGNLNLFFVAGVVKF